MCENCTTTAMSHKINLTGLACADCAEKLERRLKQMPGVAHVQLNFAAGTLVIEHDTATDKILRAISDAGYGAEIAAGGADAIISMLTVTGLDCPDCAASLTAKLRKVTGVEDAQLNFSAALLEVTHHVPLAEVLHVIEKAGYGARLVSAPTESKGGFLHTHQRLLTTIISGVFLTGAWVLSATHFAWTWLVLSLYITAILIGGYWTFLRGWSSLKARIIDMNVLMTIAVSGAALIGQWNEGATVALLYSISNMLEAYTMEKTRHSLRGLMELAPREALVKRSDVEMHLPVEQLQLGDIVIIKPGEKIPVDGAVVWGSSAANEAPITGESLPVEKQVGDAVYAGTLNEHGALDVRVNKLAEDTTLAKIIHLVEEAQTRRAPAQAFVDQFARYYTPAVLGLAVVMAVAPPLLLGHSWGVWFYRALTLVVVACPCALVISTPVAIVSAIGNAARNGVLIKGGAYLEQAGRLSAIAFDKTGTLTRGRLEITDVISLNGVSARELLALAGSVEARSPHPLAAAIVRKTHAEHVALPAADAFISLPGKGVQAAVDGRMTYVGNLRLFDELGVDMQQVRGQIIELQQQGKTPMLVGTASHLLGILAASDQVRPESKAVVQALRDAGIRQVVMLTGDHQGVAQRIADALGVDEYRADLLPDDKVRAMEELMRRHGGVGMVGDGINDAPALATATLGIAMGAGGADTALETADIALMADDLRKLPYTIRLSRRALAIIRQNIVLSLVIKAVAVALVFPGWLTLWLAVLADMGASLLVTANGLRLVGERPAPAPTQCACTDEGCCGGHQ